MLLHFRTEQRESALIDLWLRLERRVIGGTESGMAQSEEVIFNWISVAPEGHLCCADNKRNTDSKHTLTAILI